VFEVSGEQADNASSALNTIVIAAAIDAAYLFSNLSHALIVPKRVLGSTEDLDQLRKWATLAKMGHT
jgi:hypothetical protein